MKFLQSFKIILFVFIFFNYLFCSTTKAKKLNLGNVNLHLVIDAGSSGTRFCIYSIIKKVENDKLIYIPESIEGDYNNCKPIVSEAGLAKLDSQNRKDVLLKGFSELELFFPEVRKKITSIALFGTGGFRDLDKKKSDEIINEIQNFLVEKKINAKVKVITGDEEALYAYKSIKYSSNSINTDFGIIEIGGATVQLSIPVKNPIPKENVLKTISDAIGINKTFQTLHDTVNEYEVCTQAKSDFFVGSSKFANFENCKQIIKKNVLEKSNIIKTIQENLSSVKIYGLGMPWLATFKIYKKDSLSLSELNDLGQIYCKYTTEELVKTGMKEEYANRQCYSLAYQSILMTMLKIDTIYNGKGESYTRGISVEPSFFEDCK